MFRRTKIKALIFDAGGVIYDNLDKFIDRSIAKELNTSCKLFAKTLENYVKPHIKGLIDEEELWLQISSQIPEANASSFINKRPFLFYFKQKVKMKKNVLCFLEQAKKRGYRLIVLSNSIKSLTDYSRENGFYDQFDFQIISNEIGIMKPDSNMFKFAFSLTNLKPNEVIFIDDKKENILAAEKLGISSIHYHNYGDIGKLLV